MLTSTLFLYLLSFSFSFPLRLFIPFMILFLLFITICTSTYFYNLFFLLVSNITILIEYSLPFHLKLYLIFFNLSQNTRSHTDTPTDKNKNIEYSTVILDIINQSTKLSYRHIVMFSAPQSILTFHIAKLRETLKIIIFQLIHN